MRICITLLDGKTLCVNIPELVRNWDSGPHPDPWLGGLIANKELARDILVAAKIRDAASSLSNKKLQEKIDSGLKEFVSGIELPKGVNIEFNQPRP